MEAVHAFWRKRWASVFLDLLTGILYFVAGWMMVSNPKESALLLTLVIAMLLVFEGVFRIVGRSRRVIRSGVGFCLTGLSRLYWALALGSDDHTPVSGSSVSSWASKCCSTAGRWSCLA
jgi:uncharacterized membrane protein HdeD (DUF308 family)